MANEYLRRTPTSTGNRRKFTLAFWTKKGTTNTFQQIFSCTNHLIYHIENAPVRIYDGTNSIFSRESLSDRGSLYHIIFSIDTTKDNSSDRVRVYINGVDTTASGTFPTKNFEYEYNSIITHFIGTRSSLIQYHSGSFSDFFFIDGQALTPDVFGFYKQGKGYISVGSTQSTDFRPGQWVPKTPRVIKTEINRRGGFGVNGFYLPMNDSNNFGADFHCDPNSIITLNEKLPQPRVGVATTATAGIGYTNALRADPFAANLVLALPFVSGGLSSGFGDYAPSIKGSGTPNTSVLYGNTQITNVGSASSSGGYYGSSAYFDGTGDYVDTGYSVNTTFGSGNYTIECWINSWDDQNERGIFGSLANQYGISLRQFGSYGVGGNKTLSAYFGQSAIGYAAETTVRIQDQWNHVAIVKNGITGTLYLNGVAVGIATNVSAPSFTTSNLHVGAYYNSSYGFKGYIQDFRVYNTAKYTGGFDVPKPYTPVGIATWRAVPDTTANNFATLNPLIEARPSSGTDSPSNSTIVTFAGGNLDLTNSASSGNAQRMYSFGTIGISTGRWYWEVRAGSNDAVAISKGFQQKNYGSNLGSGSGIEASVGYYGGGSVSIANTAYYSTATTLTPPTFDTTNIIGIAVSANSGSNNLTVQWFKDGIGVSTVTGIGATSPVLEWFPSRLVSGSGSGGDSKYNFGQNPTFSGNTTAGTFTDSNGKGLFKYQPPTGFLALCEDNLPTPAISDPGKHFKTVLYTGDSNSGRSIVGVGFTPDLVWLKMRSATGDNYIWDTVRGAGSTQDLITNRTVAEGYNSIYHNFAFGSDGFVVSQISPGNEINYSGNTYVAWCWRAGAGTTSTNTNGSITSVVSVNQDAGFSIVSFTAQTSGSVTVGHGLGKPPAFWIYKPRNNTTGWYVYHKSLGASAWLNFDTAAATTGNTAAWGGVNPTSSVFTHGSGLVNQGNIIMYCWAEIEGFSKFGSYVGNGSADGPFVWTGFSPAWVMIKKTDSSTNWVLEDSARNATNPAFSLLQPNTTSIEDNASTAQTSIDFLSNGFKIRGNWADDNASGSNYIFAAFAQSPFSYSNSK